MSDLFAGFNEQQRQSVTATEGYFRIIAGAGSGKTRALSHRFAYLVNEIGIMPTLADGAPVLYHHAKTVEDEGRWIAKQIKELCDNGARLCGLLEGVFPSKKTATQEGMEEERRLAFDAHPTLRKISMKTKLEAE